MRLSLKLKLTLSLCAIAVILLISSIISVMEYSSMSTYVSDLIADDISSINVAQKLSDMSNRYNLDILALIGEGEKEAALPDFDDEYFISHCDILRSSLESNVIAPLTDSVVYSYSAYMMTSLELPKVMESDFIDTRSWYFDRLQPQFNRLRHSIDALDNAIYNDLEKNSKTFERGFYRSIIPGIVAVGVGLLLVLMLLFFMLAYYVNPLYKMLDSLKAYRSYGKKYTYDFEGDDQLSELNSGISEIANENLQLHSRIKALKRHELESNQ